MGRARAIRVGVVCLVAGIASACWNDRLSAHYEFDMDTYDTWLRFAFDEVDAETVRQACATLDSADVCWPTAIAAGIPGGSAR